MIPHGGGSEVFFDVDIELVIFPAFQDFLDLSRAQYLVAIAFAFPFFSCGGVEKVDLFDRFGVFGF